MIMKKHFLCIMDSLFILSHSEMLLSSSLLFSDISYIFTAWMDYMDLNVCCLQMSVKLNHSPTFLCVWHYIYYLLLYELLFFAISQICRIRKVCMSFSIWVCRTLFSRHVILMVRDVLVEIFWICGVQLRCPSIVRPRKLHSVTLSIGFEFIASFRG